MRAEHYHAASSADTTMTIAADDFLHDDSFSINSRPSPSPSELAMLFRIARFDGSRLARRAGAHA